MPQFFLNSILFHPILFHKVFPVVKAQTFAAARHGGQLPPALPAHGPATVAQGVADAVIGDLLPVIGYQSCRFPSLSSRQGLSA